MSEWSVKRFWSMAEAVPDEGGFAVHLDGRPVRTPAKAMLRLPTEAAARAVAEEWQAQGERVVPGTMPATRWANSAIDKVAPQRPEVAAMLASYAETDLLCYRAGAPQELVAAQNAAWDPLLDWAAERFGAKLIPAQGVMPQPQPARSLRRLAEPVEAMEPFGLAAFHDLVSLSGSLVIALAAIEQVRGAEELWLTSRLDEDWQSEQWGRDAEAEAQAAIKRTAFLDADRFFRLVAEEEG